MVHKVPTTQLAKMSIDLKFVELTADVLEIFFTKNIQKKNSLLVTFGISVEGHERNYQNPCRQAQDPITGQAAINSVKPVPYLLPGVLCGLSLRSCK